MYTYCADFFILFQTTNKNERLKPSHFKYSYDSGKSGIYINLREVSGRFELEPGDSVYYLSTTPHLVAAKTGQATILAVLYEG